MYFNIKKVKVPLLLLILSIVFFWKFFVYFNKPATPAMDTVWQFAIWKKIFAESLRNYKELPLWNPYMFGGTPFLGNPLSAMFYPTTWIFLLSSSELIFKFLFVTDVFLAGLFMYFFMRTIKLNEYSSLISALIFMFSGIIITKIYAGHLPNIDIISLTPLVFLFTEKLIQNKRLFYSGLISFVLTLQFLAGHVQFAFYSSMGLLLYFLFRLFFIYKETKNLNLIRRLILLFVLACFTAFLISSIQLLPAYEFGKNSIRGHGVTYEFATSYSMPPYYFITSILPNFFGTPANDTYWGPGNIWEQSIYLGVVPIFLAIFAIVFERNQYTITFFLISIFSIFFALGKFGPIYPLLFLLPLFNMFRIPSAILFLYGLSAAALAGIGSSIIFKRLNLKEKKFFLVFNKTLIFIIALIVFSSVLIWFNSQEIIEFGKNLAKKRLESSSLSEKAKLNILDNLNKTTKVIYFNIFVDIIKFVFIITFFLLVINLKLRNKGLHFIKILVILLIIFDLWYFGYQFLNVGDQYFKKDDFIDVLKSDEERHRVFILDSYKVNDKILPDYLGSSYLVYYNIEAIWGYDVTFLRGYAEYMSAIGDIDYSGPEMNIHITDIKNSKLLNLLNVKYVVTSKEINDGDFNLVYEEQGVRIYKNKNFLPRAFMVYDVKTIEDKNQILAELKSPNFEPSVYALLFKQKNISLEHSKNDSVTISYYSPNKIELDVNTDGTGILVLSEINYPGWHAYDNGKQVNILDVNYLLRGIYLNDGSHKIILKYEPFSFKLGIFFSIIGIIILLIIF